MFKCFMAKKTTKRITRIRSHPLRVPKGITIRDQHPRRIKGTYLDRKEIEFIFKTYDKRNIPYPSKSQDLGKNSDKYDDLIAVWTDYFNKKFTANPPLDPNMIKALIYSESDFRENPYNPKAMGIIQITPETHKILQDPKGETKEFTFKDIRKKDLIDPAINIPMGIRWLYRKKRLAEGKLGRAADHEDIILEYKGLLKSKTPYKDKGLEKYRYGYKQLRKK